MRDPRVTLKSPWLAGFLAFLIPGAGHWYQGRRFKAAIFTVCILTIFVWGMILGNLQPVYSQVVVSGSGGAVSIQLENTSRQQKTATRYSLGYYAQALTGVVALPAIVHQFRFHADREGGLTELDGSLDSDFIGVVNNGDVTTRVLSGQIQLEPGESGRVSGTLTGQTEEGTPIQIDVQNLNRLGRQVFGSPRREIECMGAVSGGAGSESDRVAIRGSVRRSFFNWFQAPRDAEELDRLHGELNRNFDLASVFTWIAGLLNLLAIWDAVDGPAYGYGDETQRKEKDEDDGPDDSAADKTS